MPNDNRIRFDAPLIDFTTTVGLSGQTHDNYPAPNTQARFDHLRLFLIGLLSCQSSENEPTQYRDGTWWFDIKTNMMKIYSNGNWRHASEVIQLGKDQNDLPITLQNWYDSISQVVSSLQNEVHFQSVIVTPGTTLIPIPNVFLNPTNLIVPGSKAFVHVNGVLLNPLETTLEPGNLPTAVKLPIAPNIGDSISIVIKYIQNNRFSLTEQTV